MQLLTCCRLAICKGMLLGSSRTGIVLGTKHTGEAFLAAALNLWG